MGDTSSSDIKIRSGQEQLAVPLELQPPAFSFRKGRGYSRALVKEYRDHTRIPAMGGRTWRLKLKTSGPRPATIYVQTGR